MNISRHSLIFGLSYALDIAGKNNLSHSKSTAYIAVSIGGRLGLDRASILNLYYTALLHDIGLSNSYEMVQHCVDGQKMLSKLPLPETIARDVYYHHEFYDGSGIFGLSGHDIPKNAHIICFASEFDDKFGKLSDEFGRSLFLDVRGWLDARKQRFSGDITDAFASLIKQEAFLLDYFNHETKYTLSSKLVVGDDVYYGYDDVVKFAHCFADIIDCKSPFTHTHSHGIAELARKAAAHLGYDRETQDKMYIAGLLHDIGKLDVSPGILHKNGGLTEDERFEINKHTYYTRKILEQIDGFEDIVNYAANHHERLDGMGYPYLILGEKLSGLERVMAICDVYQALTEERPYRGKLPPERVWSIIDGMAENRHLDALLVSSLKQVFD
ncbi:MAG: HD domain-containing protein [Oscillospiraceae bacterium]|nr:HD domain-containing protein [Oscillospiraceae bacterium]